MDLKIESRNVTMTPRWKTEIEARMADLQDGHDDLIHGRATLTKNAHHKKIQKCGGSLGGRDVAGPAYPDSPKRGKNI